MRKPPTVFALPDNGRNSPRVPDSTGFQVAPYSGPPPKLVMVVYNPKILPPPGDYPLENCTAGENCPTENCPMEECPTVTDGLAQIEPLAITVDGVTRVPTEQVDGLWSWVLAMRQAWNHYQQASKPKEPDSYPDRGFGT